MGDGIMYNSQTEAAKACSLNPASIFERLDSKHFPNWFRLEKI